MKKGSLVIFLLTFSISLFGQELSRKDLKYKPRSIDEAILQLDKIITEEDKEVIRILNEDEFSSGQHFSLGMWMRNEWGLWKKKELYYFFDSLGINHPDNMSGIILRSYHRHLTGKDIDLLGQITTAIKVNEKYREEDLKAERITQSTFESLHISDTVKIDILMERNQRSPQIYVIYKNGPTEEQRALYGICSILATVVGKKISLEPKQYFVDIRLLDLCGHEVVKVWYPFNKTKIGDIISFDIHGRNITRQ